MRKPKQQKSATYLVTKEYGIGMLHHCGSPTTDKSKIDETVKAASASRGNYKGIVKVRVWELIDSRDI